MFIKAPEHLSVDFIWIYQQTIANLKTRVLKDVSACIIYYKEVRNVNIFYILNFKDR
jgi:hypothetical protein